MRTIQEVTLIAATVTTGLVAGLLGAFAVAVMPALRGADDRTFVDVMQRINVGDRQSRVPVGLRGRAARHHRGGVAALGEDDARRPAWIIAGLALYLVMLIITGRINMPLNNELDAAGDPNRIGDIHAVRHQFEGQWVAWNIVRTIANVAACCCLAYALIASGRATAKADAEATAPAVGWIATDHVVTGSV